MILHGENIMIYSGGQVIASSTSCTIETSADANETSSTTSARSKDYKAGRGTWTVSVSGLVENMRNGIVMAGQEYVLTMYVSSSDMLTGKALCTEANFEFDCGKLAQGSCTFLGNGGLT